MKKLTVAVLMLALSLCFCLSAAAVEQPIDFNQKGSLSVTLSCSNGMMSGGTVTLYHIADLEWSGEEYVFVFTESFESCGLSLDDISSVTAAEGFAAFARANSVSGIEKTLVDGKAVYSELPLGLYMAVQTETSEGFTTALPFLVTVPVSGGDTWDYSVDASPKVEIEYNEISVPPNIPQTGQLKWPIPVLAVAGLLVFAFGWALCFRGSKS